MSYPDKKAFKRVSDAIGAGRVLTVRDIFDVFGPDACELFVYALMDAHDAARAIQGAINRLKNGEGDDVTSDSVEV